MKEISFMKFLQALEVVDIYYDIDYKELAMDYLKKRLYPVSYEDLTDRENNINADLVIYELLQSIAWNNVDFSFKANARYKVKLRKVDIKKYIVEFIIDIFKEMNLDININGKFCSKDAIDCNKKLRNMIYKNIII